MPCISGIYQIQSKIKPERIYIGSAVNIDERWRTHLNELKRNKHHSWKLQNHFNKYGVVDLQFSILLGCPKEFLIVNEQFFLDSYGPWFNIAPKAGIRIGIKANEETRNKIKLSRKGKPSPAKGIHWSAESRENQSKRRKGKPSWNKGKKGCFSKETIEKMINYRTGKKATEETKKKKSETNIRMGIKPPTVFGKEPWNKGKHGVQDYSFRNKKIV